MQSKLRKSIISLSRECLHHDRINLQDGIALPDGPVVISPDGLFPSLFREGNWLIFSSLETVW